MLYWAVVLLVVAIIAALFGFGDVASASAGIAQILFFIFLILLVASAVVHFVTGKSFRRSISASRNGNGLPAKPYGTKTVYDKEGRITGYIEKENQD